MKALIDNMKVEPRENARILRSALDEVKSIQTLLSDVYKDDGGGRTLLRELVQNADDANSSKLSFVILEHGWTDCQNSLLKGASLVVINNGPFTVRDHEAIHLAIGGSKMEEADKIGRFGVGLKSIFHICEAILYLGADEGVLRPGVVNPWAGTDGKNDSDPIHPDWDHIHKDHDLRKLLEVARSIDYKFSNGLLLWIPIRTREHVDRSDDGRPSGIIDSYPNTNDLFNWFSRPQSLVYLLTQCGYLDEIKVYRANGPENIDADKPSLKIFRNDFKADSWVGRHNDDINQQFTREFQGSIEAENNDHVNSWTVKGIEKLGEETLIKIRDSDDWPREHHWIDGRSKLLPRKALAHAAISVIRPSENIDKYKGVRFRWGVFLPLDDNPAPNLGNLIITVGDDEDCNLFWDIILHGYFWPSHDRKSIPGVTDENQEEDGEREVRIRWNQSVRDLLLFPLFPDIIKNILRTTHQHDAKKFLENILSTSIFSKRHLSKITQYQFLVPVITSSGVHWHTIDSNNGTILSLPDWITAPQDFKKSLLNTIDQFHDDALWFIEKHYPRLGGIERPWPALWQQKVISCVPDEVFNTASGLKWLESLLAHLIQSNSSNHDKNACIDLLVGWLSEKIANKALRPTRKASSEENEELRSQWRALFELFPNEWKFCVPLEAQEAVEFIGGKSLLGPGFLPIPLGTHNKNSPELNIQHANQALKLLGEELQKHENISKRKQDSFLMLSQSILYYLGTQSMDDELRNLPLIRATQFPEEKNYSCSINELESKKKQFSIFSKPNDNNDSEPNEGFGIDFKKKTRLLSEGIRQRLWLVDSNVGKFLSLPVSCYDEMLNKIISMEKIASKPQERLELLRYLKDGEYNILSYENGTRLRKALKHLLVGQKLTEQDNMRELYYVSNNDHNRQNSYKTLNLLLGLLGQKWRAIDHGLVAPLSQELIETIGSIFQVNNNRLHSLLKECFEREVKWDILEDKETVHLLKYLYGNTEEEKIQWRNIPLHRFYDNRRGCFNSEALIFNENIRLPNGLGSHGQLLFPDQEIKDLYRDVATLDEGEILRLMLEYEKPYNFAKDIFNACYTEDGHFIHVQDSNLKELLKSSRWLPLNKERGGTAPENVIANNSSSLFDAVRPLAKAGGLGEFFLVADLDSSFIEKIYDIITSLYSNANSLFHIRRLANAIEPVSISSIHNGEYCLPEIDDEDLEAVMQSPLPNNHRGWGVVSYAAEFLGGRDITSLNRDAKQAVIRLAQSLKGDVPVDQQIEMLNTLVEGKPKKGSLEGILFRKLISFFSKFDNFEPQILPNILLPTQDGNWNLAEKIARSESGIARQHKIIQDLREPLRINYKIDVNFEGNQSKIETSGTVKVLDSYFEKWHGKVRKGAIGALLLLFGNGLNDHILNYVHKEWFSEDFDVLNIRKSLEGDSYNPEKYEELFVNARGDILNSPKVFVTNLLGYEYEMAVDVEVKTIFAHDPVFHTGPECRDHWKIQLRDVDPQSKTSHELLDILRQSVEWWAGNVLQIDYEKVKKWWSEWGEGSQAQITPVKASINAHLPLTLHQLDVRDCPELYEAMLKAQRAQRMREQASPDNRDAISYEHNSLRSLASLIQNNEEYQYFVWKRVQKIMRRYGYSEDSVLIELAQNADDALAQLREMSGGKLNPDIRKIEIQVKSDQRKSLDFIHYGRPINDTGGASFPQGKERQWDQDLYYMMLMNLSSKPGDIPGIDSSGATTGQFGLGFKSVHFVSEKPKVISGFLAFSIAAGLLPEEIAINNTEMPLPVHDHQPTMISLPLTSSQDIDSKKLMDSIFDRFRYARVFIPVFAREIRKVVVSGGGYDGLHTFKSTKSYQAPGWSMGNKDVNIDGLGHVRLLRFLPSQEDGAKSIEAIAIAIRDGLPINLPSDVPSIWNVTPTSEKWGCGYVINGPFKLDPGRTHVSLDDEITKKSLERLGTALGNGLLSLHDLVCNNEENECSFLSEIGPGDIFLSNLWTVLTSGLDTNDELRKTFLLNLHGQGKGLSKWVTERSVVPTSLHYPFAEKLPAINQNLKLRIAASELKDIKLCQAMAKIKGVNEVIQEYDVISESNFGLLKILINEINTTPSRLSFMDIFKEALDRWNWQLDPEALHSLSGLADEELYRKLRDIWLPENNWIKEIKAKSEEGAYSGLRKLLLPAVVESYLGSLHEDDLEDELLRSKFAPSNNILDPDYISSEKDVKIFRLLRAGHGIGAETLAEWYHHLSADKYRFGLDYLLRGKLSREVLKRLRDDSPEWLRNHDNVKKFLDATNADEWEKHHLLTVLFPDNYQQIPSEPTPIQVNENFFKRMQEWWNNEDTRHEVIAKYEEEAWPDWLRNEGLKQGLENCSKAHWMVLLILGACRSIGRTKDSQHRSFLEFLKNKGWWETFKDHLTSEDWMNVLKEWQDESSIYMDKLQWMSLFPSIYQFSRYYEVYCRLLITSSKRPVDFFHIQALLAPRVDPALTGAGKNFDAPPAPVNFGLHWILRELYRMEIIKGDHIAPFCWVPSSRLIEFLQGVGMPVDDNSDHQVKAKSIHNFIQNKTGSDKNNFHCAFDIPLLHIIDDEELKRELGWR